MKVEDFEVERHFGPNLPKALKAFLMEEVEGSDMEKVETVHVDSEGKKVSFDFHQESSGTQRLYNFAGPWLDTLEKGNVLFIDELHLHLHEQMVEYLVRQFHSRELNKKGAQLIFTTHDTSIMNQNLFRRDQFWFVEADRQGASSLFPLTDFYTRNKKDNIASNYLSGRYGALPHLDRALIPKLH